MSEFVGEELGLHLKPASYNLLHGCVLKEPIRSDYKRPLV